MILISLIKWFLMTLILMPCLAMADDESTNIAPTSQVPNLQSAPSPQLETSPSLAQSQQDRRALNNYYGLLNYSPLDLVIPGKWGATVGYNFSGDRTFEFEYLHGGFSVPYLVKDLGSMSDNRMALQTRSYAGRSSFNFNYGVSYYDFSVHLGNKFLNRLSGGAYPSTDLIRIQTLGLNWGIGNSWTFSNGVTLSIDWLSWAQPLYVLRKQTEFLNVVTNSQDREDIESLVSVASYFPRFLAFKIQLGMRFCL